MIFKKLTPDERVAVFGDRAEAWKGTLSSEQFIERNHRLYKHPFGQKRISTYALIDEKKICASMDILDIELKVKRKSGIESEKGCLLASVITPKEMRNQGYAKKLLSEFFDARPTLKGVGYSDIGPEYYKAYGFAPQKVYVVEGNATEKTLESSPSIELKEFLTGLNTCRQAELLCHSENSAFVAPDPEFLDWHLERYRYFAEITQNKLPEKNTYRLIHSNQEHLIFSVPNFAKNLLEGLRVTSGCIHCEAWLSNEAFRLGLKGYLYWDVLPPAHSYKHEWPVLRTGHQNSFFVDPQLCDWW